MSTMPPIMPRRRGNLMWPVLLIAVGFMFLLEEFVPHWGVGKTWPILLILIGILKLLEISQPPRPPEGPRL